MKLVKTYLVEFEFICGEYGQIFMHVFEAFGEEEVEEKIQDYLKAYYGDVETECVDDTWYYFSGEVAVKCHGYSEVTNSNYVVERLKV